MIRKAKKDDLKDILLLYQQLFPGEDYSSVETFSKTWSRIVSDDKISCFIAYNGDFPVASCLIRACPRIAFFKKIS